MGAATTMAPPAPVQQGGQVPATQQAGATPTVGIAPFTRSAYEHDEPFYDSGTVAFPQTSAQQIGPVDVPAFGFLRGIWLLVQVTGGTGTAAVAKEDAPWSVLQQIVLNDVNGAPIVGPLDGYALFLANKYGGYYPTPPGSSPSFSAVATSGNFSFLVYVPLEVGKRDALGAVPNQNAASTYKLSAQLGPASTIYSTNPTGFGNIRVQAWLDAWTQPAPTDIFGRPQAQVPPANGTVAFWTSQVFNVAAGSQTFRLTRVGNMIRALVLIGRTTAPARSATVLPDPMQLLLDGRILDNVSNALQAARTRNLVDDANETGVVVKPFHYDLNGRVGYEMRDLWLPTSQASRLEISGTFAAAGTLQVLTHDVIPNGDPYIT